MIEVHRAKIIRGRSEPVSRKTPCAFVISVGNHGPDFDALCAGWDWTEAAFDRCAILLGDSLLRLTIEATEAKTTADAEREAALRASLLARQLAQARPHAPIMQMSDIARDSAFAPWMVRVQDAFEHMPAFKSMIVSDAVAFCERQHRHGRLASQFDAAFALSIRYLIEEVAIYAVLAERGWLAETYFGSELTVLAALMRGVFPGVAPVLERRTHISLRVSSLRRAA